MDQALDACEKVVHMGTLRNLEPWNWIGGGYMLGPAAG